jgi:hypothetical protein
MDSNTTEIVTGCPHDNMHTFGTMELKKLHTVVNKQAKKTPVCVDNGACVPAHVSNPRLAPNSFAPLLLGLYVGRQPS